METLTKIICIALVVGVIGPLFWLFVGWLANCITSLLVRAKHAIRGRLSRHQTEKASAAGGRLR